MRKGAFIFLILGASFFIPTTSYGAVIVEQTDYSIATSTYVGSNFFQTLGTNISGTISTVEFVMRRTAGSPHTISFSLLACDNSDYSSCTLADNHTSFTLSTTTAHLVQLTSTYAFVPAKYYYFTVNNVANSFQMYGTNINRYANGSFCYANIDANCGTHTMKDFYFKFSSSGTVSNNTRIVSLNAPLNGATTASTSSNTTSGIASSGVKVYDADGKDIEGNYLDGFDTIQGIHIQVDSGKVSMTEQTGDYTSRILTGTFMELAASGISTLGSLTLSATLPANVTVTVVGYA